MREPVSARYTEYHQGVHRSLAVPQETRVRLSNVPPGPAPTPNQPNGEEADPRDGASGRREVNAGGGSAIVNPDEKKHPADRVASDEILAPVDTAAAVLPPEAPRGRRSYGSSSAAPLGASL
jgi:hypothetical protein